MLDERIRQNLADAGCSEEFMASFEEAGDDAERLRRLRSRRKELLVSLHADQYRLDCLDYLIYQMKKKAS